MSEGPVIAENKKPHAENTKPQLLCVDDEVEITSALKRVLIRDFEVIEVHSVGAAKAILKENSDIAVVLTDHRMPDGTGLELLEFAQATRPEAVRALLTAHVDLSAFFNAVNNALVHRLILKPWDNEYLRAQMIESLAAHTSLLERTELERLAITDVVTLVRNHRFFQDQLKIEVERANRHGRVLSLIMIDIDHFKAVNDRFGHPAGDAILRQVASRLTEGVRTLDTVSRYGGEEFALILPDTDVEGASLVAGRLREAIASQDFGLTTITISLGIATLPAHATTSHDLVRKADAALYTAKRQGRNQSVVASVDSPSD